jgi:chemotaxis protein CheZ
MPVQRKVFRIEQPAGISEAGAAQDSDAALRHLECLSEIRALRDLIEARAAARRDELRAQTPARRAEPDPVQAAVRRSHGEVEAFGAALERLVRASRELDAVVGDTEQATQQVLRAAEQIDQNANTLAATTKSKRGQDVAGDIRRQVAQIYQACNFQDLTGQRVGKVIEILAALEQHAGRLLEIWRSIEQCKPAASGPEGDDKFLNGPKLEGDGGHSSQDDIDTMFGCA